MPDINQEIIDKLGGISSENLRVIPNEIVNCLKGKGLTFGQAEALLDYTKGLLKNVKI